MLNFFVNRFPIDLRRIVSQSLVVGALSATGLISGWVPSLSLGVNPTLVFSTSAYAQSNEELRRFGQIILEYESKRRNITSQIASIIGSKNVPDIACNDGNQPQISGSLPRNAMPLAQQLCNEYISTIRKYGMSRERFEEILTNMSSNPELKRRVDGVLINLQQ